MELSRREFLVGTAACAGAMCAGCVTLNPAPTFDAASDGSLPIPAALSRAGDEIKVRLPDSDAPVLVWRTADGYGAASVVCTHRGCEVSFNGRGNSLDCPCHGSRFATDGSVLHGPATRPLRRYEVEITGSTLRVRPV
jgi:Rieske Fe-S protein